MIQIIIVAIEKTEYKWKSDISIVLDPAASEFYQDDKYVLKADNSKLSPTEMVTYYANLILKISDHFY